MTSLGLQLPEEIKRVIRLRDIYLDLPNGAGKIGATFMLAALDRALDAYKNDDVVAMLQAYEELKGFEE